MLEAAMSPVRVPDEMNFFSIYVILPALRSTRRLLIEMSTRNFPGGKKRKARRADNLAAI
jgi:hypothetical protein